MFWNTNRPYEIAKGITHGDELYNDLVATVYLIMSKKKEIRDEEKYFSRCALNQWHKHNSEFNKKYRPYYTTEINEEITEDYSCQWVSSKYKKVFYDYLDKTPDGGSGAEWFKRQIVKFVLIGMTQQEIQERYGINQAYVSKTIKQFKNDVRNYYIERCGGEDNDNI